MIRQNVHINTLNNTHLLRLGYEEKALQAKEAILKMVQELDDFVKQDLSIDHRIHSRLIGRRGRTIRQVQSTVFKYHTISYLTL